MEVFYIGLFTSLAVLAAILEFTKEGSTTSVLSNEFKKFRNNYLLVYSLAMAGDWLQGPYVYALYQYYGFDRGDIGRLFIAGFGSSMIFGTIVGGLADKTGRKKACLLYCATYMLGCFTKHFNNFYVLLVGRLFCGVSTSLLFSAFESWLVAEHFHRGYDGDWLGHTFSMAVFLGNGLMAIVSGLGAHSLVETFAFGPVSPFDAAAVVLTVAAFIIANSWSENFGSKAHTEDGEVSAVGTFKRAATVIFTDQKVALLGAMQALFEGSMYTFVFLWTPALAPRGEHLPHGFVFAIFMVASMVGSALAGRLMSRFSRYRIETYMQGVFVVSALALAVPVLYHTTVDTSEKYNAGGPGISFDGKVQLIAFCVFEVMVGLFWPSMMKMRSLYVPEEMRSTIINFFRFPLNLFVCVVLYNVQAFPLSFMFGLCATFLLVAAGCQKRLEIITIREEQSAKTDEKIQLMDS